MVRYGEFRALPVRIATARSGGHKVIEPAAQFRHGSIHREKILCCHRAESHHDFWLDNRNLAHEKWRAGLALVAFRSTVPRRTSFHNVRDIDLFSIQAHGFDHVVEQLSGPADERLALRIFIGSGSLTDKH